MENTIDKKSPVPLYYQLKNTLMKELKKFELSQKFLTEEEICDKFKVSRITVRKSLEEMAKEGYIEKKRGLGSIVIKKPKIAQNFTMEIKSFNQEMYEKKMQPFTQVLSLELINSTLLLENKLQLSSHQKIIKLVRIRGVEENIPQLCVTTYIPLDIIPNFKEYDFVNNSYYSYLENNNMKITKVQRTFEARIASSWEKSVMKLTENEAIAYFETVAFSDNRPVEFSCCSYNGALNSFNIEIIK